MKKTLLQKISFLLLFISILWNPSTLLAQTTIRGIIKDKGLNEPLIGAHITIQGTNIGTSSDLDGYYQLTSDHPLPWIIEVTYIGFSPVFITITKESNCNVELIPAYFTLKNELILGTNSLLLFIGRQGIIYRS